MWLDKLYDGLGWWTETEQECIVRLETVLNTDVDMLEESETNPLPNKLTSTVKR